MSYTPTTWSTGDTITTTKLNKMEQGIAGAGGGGYDFVITGEWDGSDWVDLTLESGSYSDLVAMLQNDSVPSGTLHFTYDGSIRIGFLTSIIDLSGDNMVSCGFSTYTPWDNAINAVFFMVNSDGTVDPD